MFFVIGLIIVIIGIGAVFFSNILNIFFILMMLCGIVFGIYVLGSNVVVTFSRGNPLFLVSGIALGVFSAVGVVYTWCSLELNPTDDYYILGEVSSDSRLISILIFGIVVIILAVLNAVAWDPEAFGGSAICILVTSVVAAYCIFFAVVGTKSYSDNTLKEYDFTTMTTEYRLKDDAGIYYFDSEKGVWPIQFDFLQLPFGSFEEGEEVYVLSLISSNGCIEVSNGEKCGYVKEEDLEALQTVSR